MFGNTQRSVLLGVALAFGGLGLVPSEALAQGGFAVYGRSGGFGVYRGPYGSGFGVYSGYQPAFVGPVAPVVPVVPVYRPVPVWGPPVYGYPYGPGFHGGRGFHGRPRCW